MSNLPALHLLPVWALANWFVMMNGSESLRPILTGPTMAYLNSRVAFRCITPDAALPVTYELIKDSGVPIDIGTDLQGNQSAPFFLKVTATSGGSYYCQSRTKDSTGVSNSIRLTVVIPPSVTMLTSNPFPPVAYEGSRLILSCNVTKGSHLSYSWFYNRREMTLSAFPTLRAEGNTLVIERVRPSHAGHYYCMAWSAVQDIKRFSSSTEVQVTVKVYVSKPKISFSISKEADGYRGNISCWVSRGSPPINFTFSLDNKEVGSVTASESLMARFYVPMVPGMDMGEARCRVQTEVQDLMSEPLTLEVVPVGGDIKVQVEYLYRADNRVAAAKLGCHISRGTFPYVSWLHNGSVLSTEMQTDFYIPQVTPPFTSMNRGQTLFLAMLGPEEFGSYRCKARDSYDDTGPWVESEDVLVQVKGHTPCFKHLPTLPTAAPPKLYMTTIETISITFCGFLLLSLVVGVACVYKISNKKQINTNVTATNFEGLPMSTQESDAHHQIAEVTA